MLEISKIVMFLQKNIFLKKLLYDKRNGVK